MFKKTNKKRLTILLVSLSLVLAAGVGATLAYVFASTGDVVNTFTPSHVSCAVVEDVNYDDEASKADETVIEDNDTVEYVEVKSNVKIKNTGDTDAYIRVAVIINWKNEDGHVWATAPKTGEYTITYNTPNSKWAKSTTDGYWYYTSEVAPNGLTDVLITSATQNAPGPKGTDGTQYYLSIEIVASAIQSTPDNVVKDMWGATASNGTITAIPSGTVTTN